MMDLSRVDRDTLIDLLVHGDNTPANIADNIGSTGRSVRRRITSEGGLADQDLVRRKGTDTRRTGVYTLTRSGVQIARDLYKERNG